MLYFLCLVLAILSPITQTYASSNIDDLNRERIMAPGMWHKISNGDPIVESTIKESAYIVVKDDKQGTASFQIALVRVMTS